MTTTIERMQVYNAKTGKVSYLYVPMEGVITEAEAIALDEADVKRRKNEIIKAQLEENDIKVIRALVEGDQSRIEAHRIKQSELRALLQEL